MTTSQSDLDLIKRLRLEVEVAHSEVERWKIYAKRAIAEHQETRTHLAQVIVDSARQVEALRFYLEDDRRCVEQDILETVAMRPAFAALGGIASGLCSAHREPSRTCRLCYPNPRRPRVTPVPSNVRPF